MFGLGRLAHFWIGSCARCGDECRVGLCATCRAQGVLSYTTSSGLPCWGIGKYDGLLAERIGRLKFHDETAIALHLGNALAQLLPQELVSCSLLPVPLHPVRLCERGYNQSTLLASAIRRKNSPAISVDLLARTSQTAQQSRLERAERKGNTSGAFTAVSRHPAMKPRQGVQLLIVDDVITSGSTVESCAEALRRAGWSVRGAICCALALNDAQFTADVVTKSQAKTR